MSRNDHSCLFPKTSRPSPDSTPSSPSSCYDAPFRRGLSRRPYRHHVGPSASDGGRKRSRVYEPLLVAGGDGKRQRFHDPLPPNLMLHAISGAKCPRYFKAKEEGEVDTTMLSDDDREASLLSQSDQPLELEEELGDRSTIASGLRDSRVHETHLSSYRYSSHATSSSDMERSKELVDIFSYASSKQEAEDYFFTRPIATPTTTGLIAQQLDLDSMTHKSFCSDQDFMLSHSTRPSKSLQRSRSAGCVLSRASSSSHQTATTMTRTRAGFRNVGNSCYISCILAALYSVTELVERMKTFGHMVHQILTLRQLLENHSGSKSYLTRSTSTEGGDSKIPGCSLFNAILSLAIDFQPPETTLSIDDRESIQWNVGSPSIDIGLLKSLVSDQCPFFAGFEQQDAHEFLIVILDAMEEQLVHQMKELMKDVPATTQFVTLRHTDVRRQELIELETLVGLREPVGGEPPCYENTKRCDRTQPSTPDQLSVPDTPQPALISSPTIARSYALRSKHPSLSSSPSSTDDRRVLPTSLSQSPSSDPPSGPSLASAFRTSATDDELKVLIPTYHMMTGSVANLLRCPKCNYQRQALEAFRVVTLAIPLLPKTLPISPTPHVSQDNSEPDFLKHLEALSRGPSSVRVTDFSDLPPIHLEKLLDYYTRRHLLDCRCSQEGCVAQKVETRHWFIHCPKIILFHINRIIPKGPTDSTLMKIRRRVIISLNLNLAPYIIKDSISTKDEESPILSPYKRQHPTEDEDDAARVVIGLELIDTEQHNELVVEPRRGPSVSVSSKFTLKAIISHIGQRPHTGHFLAYIRNPLPRAAVAAGLTDSITTNTDGSSTTSNASEIRSDVSSLWHCHNDSDVRMVTPLVVDRAVQRDSYILVYEQSSE